MLNIETKKMSLTSKELWEELYNTLPQPLKEDEKTIAMIMQESKDMGRVIDFKSAQKMLELWEKEGKVQYVGKRAHNGKSPMAWRVL